jgi:hypothetical protein
MRIHLGVACATIAMLASLMGCGSYSSPSNSDNDPTPPSPDSTGDNTPTPPPPGY